MFRLDPFETGVGARAHTHTHIRVEEIEEALFVLSFWHYADVFGLSWNGVTPAHIQYHCGRTWLPLTTLVCVLNCWEISQQREALGSEKV